MSDITLNIDDIVCKGSRGDTILEVARKNDVYIPTMCFLEGLSPMGSCRMCVVEVEGNPKLMTSCTTPASDGMKVHTKTEKLRAYRKQILELLFAGRNHFCMFCSQSGDCELQRLAIEHGMDAVRYPFLYADFNNDTSDGAIQVDHNRCVLCLRCIRVCAEKVGAHTLDLDKRGWASRVVADIGLPLGKSDTCVTCGACAQVCPTGTITLREFAYRGRRHDCDDQVESICPLCAMGCRIRAFVRTGSVARVEGVCVDCPDGGQLCRKGRWGLPESTERERVTKPMIRQGSTFREATWDEALTLAADRIRAAAPTGRAGAVVSELCTDEELSIFADFFKGSLRFDKVDCFAGDALRGFVRGFEPFTKQGLRPFTGAHDILQADAILLLGANPQDEAPVTSSYIRVATIRNGAKLLNVSHCCDPYPNISDADLRVPVEDMGTTLATLTGALERREPIECAGMAVLDAIASHLRNAKKPVVVIGSAVARFHPELVTAAVNVAIAAKAFFGDGLGVVPMVTTGNGLGTVNTILADTPWVEDANLDFMYVFSTGMVPDAKPVLEAMSRARFVVAHTPYMVHPLVNMADILLPAPAWYERSGHYCTLEGERRRMNLIVSPKAELRGLSVILHDIAAGAGVPFETGNSAVPCENVFKSTLPPEQARIAAVSAPSTAGAREV
jgi:formate dehydrogenase major subunit